MTRTHLHITRSTIRWCDVSFNGILILGGLLCATQGMALDYQVEGFITTEGWSPVQRPGSAPLESKRADFVLVANGSLWNIRVKEVNNPFDFHECGTDGVDLYTLIALEAHNEKLRKDGKRAGANVGSGFVDPGPVPHSYWSPYISVLWLAYASSSYFDTVTNQLAEPILFYILQQRRLHTIGFKQRIDISRLGISPLLPSHVAYYADGKFRYWEKDDLVGYAPPKESVYLPPYESGFTNSYYRIITVTNVDKYQFPMSFEFLTYDTKTNAQSAGDLFVQRRFWGVVTNVSFPTERGDYLPRFNGMITVRDQRFTRRGLPESRIESLVTNRWPTLAEAEASPDYRAQVAIEPRRREAIQQEARRKPGHRTTSRYAVYAFFAVAVVAPAFFLCLPHLRRWGASRDSKTNKPRT